MSGFNTFVINYYNKQPIYRENRIFTVLMENFKVIIYLMHELLIWICSEETEENKYFE